MKLQLTGKLHSIARDFLTNKIIISLLVNESDFSTEEFQWSEFEERTAKEILSE